MLIRKLTLVAVALLFSLPTAAEASDINVEAGQVRVNTTVNGNINVQSGQNRVNVNSPKLPVRVNSHPNQKLSNCSTRTRTRRANCRQSTTVRRNPSNTSTTTIVVQPPLKKPSSRVETTQRSGCRGDGSRSSQRVSQTNNSSEVVVHSSVTTNGCR
jgi:hypothetical protein